MFITDCDEKTWEEFLDKSPQASIYSRSAFLKSYDVPVRYILFKEREMTLGGAVLLLSGEDVFTGPFQAYNGILFSDFSKLKSYKQLEIQFSVTEAFTDLLFTNYRQVSFSNHWSVQDVRPFDWFNYHEREKGYFQIRVIYTSILDIRPSSLLNGCKGVRINSLKTSGKYNLDTRLSTDVNQIDRLHELTFARQGIKREVSESRAVRSICQNLIQNDSGRLFLTYQGNIPAAASFFGIDGKRAYYLFGATDPEFRKTEVGTRNLFDAFRVLNENHGLCEVDLVGVNSPQRGGYKLTFGGNLVPYFAVKKVLA